MISKDTVGAIWNIRDIGGSFQMVGDAVTCDTFLHNALQLAEAKHDTKMVREIQLCLSDNNIEMGRYDSAIIYLSPVLENKLKNDESPIYTNASRIYYHQGKLDSALYYIGKVLGVGNVYGKRTAYRNRTRIDLIRGDVASAKSDFENYVLYIDSIDRITSSEALTTAGVLGMGDGTGLRIAPHGALPCHHLLQEAARRGCSKEHGTGDGSRQAHPQNLRACGRQTE